MDNQDPFIEIPELFHSFMTKAPFERCISCEQPLLNDDTTYVIEKAIKKDDVIIEYAMCETCTLRKSAQISKESRENFERFHSEHFDPNLRTLQLYTQYGSFDFEGWISECVLTGQPRHKLEEYSVIGVCVGRQLAMGPFPYMVSPEGRMQMAELHSAKTKDELDRFIDDNFGLPPELQELFRDREIVLI